MLVLLAVFQMVAPSVAAIADAWRLDRREAYAHIESESSDACAVVHDHDCVLCTIATAPTGTAPAGAPPFPVCAQVASTSGELVLPHRQTLLRAAPPRAPPASKA